MLSRAELLRREIISGFDETCARAATYDVRIDCIIDSKGDIHYDHYILKPQEVAWVVSRELISLPDDVTATAHIKTSLCNDGLLALNTGIVDSLWSGPLSTPILNFGKISHVLRSGDEFLRLMFQEHPAWEQQSPTGATRIKYIAEKQDKAVRFFGDKFLDASAILKEAINNNMFKYAGSIGIATGLFVAIVAGVLTIGAIIINSSAFYGPTYYSSYLGKAGEASNEQRKLELRIEELESAVRSLKSLPH